MKKWIAFVSFVCLTLCLYGCGAKEVTELSCNAVIGKTTVSGRFSGTAVGKKPNGVGTMVYDTADGEAAITGEWEKGRLISAEHLVNDGFTASFCGEAAVGKYSGDVDLQGIPNGRGTFKAEGLTYTGGWADGAPAGEGTIEMDSLTVTVAGTEFVGTYSGPVVDGTPNGEGSFTAGGTTYTGGWANGVPAGEGTIETDRMATTLIGYEMVGIYSGAAVDGVASGSGTFIGTNEDGDKIYYRGEWKDGLAHGHGLQYWDDPDWYSRTGNFEKGSFVPTVAEQFASLGTRETAHYTLNDNTLWFFNKYAKVFKNNDLSSYDGPVDRQFKVKEFTKNPSKYGQMPVEISGRVAQIWEKKYFGSDMTYMLIVNGSRDYFYVFMYGSTGATEGTWVQATVLPLAYSTYKTVSNNSQWAIFCAGIKTNK